MILISTNMEKVNYLFKNFVIMCYSKVLSDSLVRDIEKLKSIPDIDIQASDSDNQTNANQENYAKEDYKNIPFYHHFKNIQNETLKISTLDDIIESSEKKTIL